MKNTILILLLITFELVCSAQTKIKKGSYKFIENIITDFSPLKEKGKSQEIEIEKYHKVTVVGMSDDLKTVYIKYWNYPSRIKSKKNWFSKATFTNNQKADDFNQKLFELPSESFKKITVPLYSRYKGTTVGVYTIPFRLRGIGDDFDFESSLSLQANLVAGLGKRSSENSWIDFSLGIGLTGVNLTSKNSDVAEQRTASAFTLSSGVVIKPSKFANIGLFVGWDNLGSNDKDVNWKYNGDMWLGLGINISFNTISTDQSANRKEQK
jgi:hypothetical protein